MTAAAAKSGHPYANLFSPIRVGAHLLRNRIIMGSMHTRMEHMSDPVARQVAFYAARAKGGVALIISGGHSPNTAGLMEPGAPILHSRDDLPTHRAIVKAVHEHGAKMLLQIIHAGRSSKHPQLVGPSEIKSPICPFKPRALTAPEIEETIEDYVRCAELAAEAGYDGVEIMGSEGYLINQFTVTRTNDRTDSWGGDLENRLRLPVEIVRRTRERLGRGFMIMYRISALDLVEGGATAPEIDRQAVAIQAAGADLLNTGIGWHESAIPTIAYPVPRAAWGFATERIRSLVTIPVVASNRINTPEVAEQLIASGTADLVSMARPMLADPDFAAKAEGGRRAEINVCIACNQACLDYIFTERTATCLVNPIACREIEFEPGRTARPRKLAVVGSGPAGLSAAIAAAERGHDVTLFEADDRIGGQLNLAARIPGKTEFNELLRYFAQQVARKGVAVRTSTRADAASLREGGFEHVIVATGIVPRRPDIPGIDHPSVVMYPDLIAGRAQAGERVLIIGAGGIGFDVAELLTAQGSEEDRDTFLAEWGVDARIREPGGLGARPHPVRQRQVTLLQRSASRMGERLGKTTGWILRGQLKHRGVRMLTGCQYLGIADDGLSLVSGGQAQTLAADTIVICAGQDSNAALAGAVEAAGIPVSVIGGAQFASELDALRAIDQGTRLAYGL